MLQKQIEDLDAIKKKHWRWGNKSKGSKILRNILFKDLKEKCVTVSLIENLKIILCIPVDKKAYTTILKSCGLKFMDRNFGDLKFPKRYLELIYTM